MVELEYLTDKKGRLKGVIIPVEMWRKVFPEVPKSLEEFTEAIEDYCLNKALVKLRTRLYCLKKKP